MRYDGIKFVLYSFGYGVYLVDHIDGADAENIIKHMENYGLDVIEVIPNLRDLNQIFAVTKHGRPPCMQEKSQTSDLIISDLDVAVGNGNCYYLPQRLAMLKCGLTNNLVAKIDNNQG